MNIQEIKEYAINKLRENKVEDYNLKAKLLICNIINKPKEYLIIHDKEVLEERQELEIKNNINKILEGYPVQYIINHQEFMGLEFFVNENVLIPQPDTEILVEEVINIANNIEKTKILDLCTGSGAIAVSLKKYIKETDIIASDISIEVLKVAKINAEKSNTKIKFIKSDLFENIEEKFDIIVSNPPYIKTEIIKHLSLEVQNEPHLALDGGQDGLEFYRQIINNAYKYLKKEGYLALEIGYDQKKDVIQIIENSNQYKDIYAKKDFAGNDRIIVCKRR